MKTQNQTILTITQLNEYIKMLIDANPQTRNIWIKGELSNFKNYYTTGHLYFSLKDNTSVIKAVMFKTSAVGLNFEPKDGMKVLVHGRVSCYTARGEYQIYVDEMQPDGIGALTIAFEQLKQKLGDEGLFEQSIKKDLPRIPQRVGVITSASGAAVHDIINIATRRYPMGEIIIYPALVQGEHSARSLCGGIKYFNEKSPVDVIIIGRGGGSIEDLWSFNDEGLARVIFGSCIPVVSAVGHETDFTICDFVADLRAPTPSAAAELVFPNITDLYGEVDYLNQTLTNKAQGEISALQNKVSLLQKNLQIHSPQHVLNDKMLHLDKLTQSLEFNTQKRITEYKNQLGLSLAKLESVNPLAVLCRGYAIVQKENGEVVGLASELKADDKIKIKLFDGDINAVVK